MLNDEQVLMCTAIEDNTLAAASSDQSPGGCPYANLIATPPSAIPISPNANCSGPLDSSVQLVAAMGVPEIVCAMRSMPIICPFEMGRNLGTGRASEHLVRRRAIQVAA